MIFHTAETITTFDGQHVDLPEMPKVVMAYSCRVAAANGIPPDTDSHGSFGFATIEDEVAVGSGAALVFFTDVSGSRIANKLLSEIDTEDDSSVTDWSLVSLDCDPNGFTLDKTTPNPVQQFGSFLGLCGSSQFEAHVGTFNARNNDEGAGDRIITGVGFRPQLVMFLWAKTAGFTAYNDSQAQGGPAFGFGAASSTDAANQFAHHTTNFYIVGAATHCVHKGGVCGVFVDPAGLGSIKANMTLTSFNSDGFTVHFDASDYVPDTGGFGLASNGRLIGYIALRDPLGGFHVGQANAKTSTGHQPYTGAGFQPEAVLLAHGSGNTDGVVQVGGPFHIGAFDDLSQTSMLNGRTLGGARLSTAALTYAGGGTSIVQQAERVSLDSDGFTLNWSATDGVARPFGWIAMKTHGLDPGCNPGGAPPLIGDFSL